MFSFFGKPSKIDYEKLLTQLEVIQTKNKVLYDYKKKQQQKRKHFKENLKQIEKYIELITEHKDIDVSQLNLLD